MNRRSRRSTRPTCSHTQRAGIVLGYARDSASNALATFHEVRPLRQFRLLVKQGTAPDPVDWDDLTPPVGTPTYEEQDMLRAMVIFSAAGLDSALKYLLRDALPVLIYGGHPRAIARLG